jgi:MerR family transcriptional regulator, light-induced transcriptional regulator
LFTIKQASRLTGVPEATLRTWERRYGVVTPERTDSGYRLYGSESIAVLTAMRKLVDAGWTPAEAGRAIRNGTLPVTSSAPPAAGVMVDDAGADATTYTDRFLRAAASIDLAGIDESLDLGFATGSFEHVVDTWLCPTLVALGDGWARGDIDVAGEHMASHAALRRLSAAFEAAGSRSRGSSVVVGLPPGSQHELGALAFAAAAKRRGLNVLYLGPNVPDTSWDAGAAAHSASGAVLGVVTPADRPDAIATARRLLANHPRLLVASGGAFGADLAPGVKTLPSTIGAAAQELDFLLHAEATD